MKTRRPRSPTAGGTTAVEHLLDGSLVPFAAFDARVLHGVELAPGSVRLFEIEP